MPLSIQAIRSLSAVTIAVGGWRRSPALIVTEAALVGLGWSTGRSPLTATPTRHHRISDLTMVRW